MKIGKKPFFAVCFVCYIYFINLNDTINKLWKKNTKLQDIIKKKYFKAPSRI